MRSNQARKIDIVIEKLVPTIRAVLAEHFVETPTRRPVFRELPGDAERAAEVDEVTPRPRPCAAEEGRQAVSPRLYPHRRPGVLP
jgi:hypothetical protein